MLLLLPQNTVRKALTEVPGLGLTMSSVVLRGSVAKTGDALVNVMKALARYVDNPCL